MKVLLDEGVNTYLSPSPEEEKRIVVSAPSELPLPRAIEIDALATVIALPRIITTDVTVHLSGRGIRIDEAVLTSGSTALRCRRRTVFPSSESLVIFSHVPLPAQSATYTVSADAVLIPFGSCRSLPVRLECEGID